MVSHLIVRIDSVLTIIIEEIPVGMSTYINIVFVRLRFSAPIFFRNFFKFVDFIAHRCFFPLNKSANIYLIFKHLSDCIRVPSNVFIIAFTTYKTASFLFFINCPRWDVVFI